MVHHNTRSAIGSSSRTATLHTVSAISCASQHQANTGKPDTTHCYTNAIIVSSTRTATLHTLWAINCASQHLGHTADVSTACDSSHANRHQRIYTLDASDSVSYSSYGTIANLGYQWHSHPSNKRFSAC